MAGDASDAELRRFKRARTASDLPLRRAVRMQVQAKRTTRRRRRFLAPKDYMTKSIMSKGALLPKCRVSLPWVSIGEYLPRTASTSQTNVYNLNSIYQVHGTDTHQPMWHDKWSALYSTYRVWAADYEIKFDGLGGTALTATTPEQLCYAYVGKSGAPSFGATTATNQEVESYLEMVKGTPNAHYTLICPPGIDGRKSVGVIKGRIKFDSMHDDFADTVNDQASFGASPSEFVYLYTGITDMNGVSRTDSIKVTAKIMFHVILSHPANQTQN